jgi:ADP-heptose:LPS heptosyltransferase
MIMRLRGARIETIRKGRLERFMLVHHIRTKALKHTTVRYGEVLQRLGLTVSDLPAVHHTTGDGVGIAPFAAHRGKIYPLERMEEVVRMLSESGERVVLFGGGKKEKEILDSWAKKYKGVESIAGKYSLAKEMEIMRGLRVMLSMDSANMHLASLAGTRVVSVWGATHPDAGFLGFGQSESDCIQRELKCRPCSIYGNKKCKYGDYRCMDIPPEVIVERLER